MPLLKVDGRDEVLATRNNHYVLRKDERGDWTRDGHKFFLMSVNLYGACWDEFEIRWYVQDTREEADRLAVEHFRVSALVS